MEPTYPPNMPPAPAGYTPPAPATYSPPAPTAQVPPTPTMMTPKPTLGFGEVFSVAWAVFKKRWAGLIGIGAIVTVIAIILALATVIGLIFLVFAIIDPPYGQTSPIDLSTEGLVWLTSGFIGLFILVVFLLSWWGQLTVCAIIDGELRGEHRSVGAGLAVGFRRLGSFVPVALLAGIGYALLLGGLITATLAIVESFMNSPTGAIGALLGVGTLALVGVVLSVFLTVKWFLTLPVMVVENKTVWSAINRSWALTRGSGGTIFGIYILISVAINSVNMLIQAPMSIPGDINYLDGIGDLVSVTTAVLALVMLVLAIITYPILSMISQVIYHDRALWESYSNTYHTTPPVAYMPAPLNPQVAPPMNPSM
ncbi:MAG: glycerophosphoryl diester phosphodiesterase membrane domain-containing protein [Propionibacteriaceae bacterium]|nr:glycerophosphoryl diester phosphodiesterase membrane domain-containing protein [Propionibacteriaceae bacterium]